MKKINTIFCIGLILLLTGCNSNSNTKDINDSSSDIETHCADISLKDNHTRASLTAQALIELGYRNFGASFNPEKCIIVISMIILEGEDAPIKEDFIDTIQTHIEMSELEGKATVIDVNDIELQIERVSEVVDINYT